MVSRALALATLASIATPLVLFGACNTVLDNAQGTLEGQDAGPDARAAVGSAPDAGAAASDVASPDTGGGSLPDEDAATAVPPGGGGEDGGPSSLPACGAGEKLCDGACVNVTDPLFGCGASACVACALPHAVPACSASGCAIGACEPGYADCDQKASNGCETDLSQAAHCGTCNARCTSALPDCSPTGTGFACTTGCSGGAPTLCGSQCVNLSTSVDDCGACDDACPAPTNGSATCSGGHCGVMCAAGFHACAGECASAHSTATCGAGCQPCPTAANETATCDGVSCGTACLPHFADCDGLAADGCEAALLTDPNDCGACGVVCASGRCNSGGCVALPPDAGPADAGGPPPADSGPPPPVDSGPPPPVDAGETDSAPPPPDAGETFDAADFVDASPAG
jgi:hypothetical protein